MTHTSLYALAVTDQPYLQDGERIAVREYHEDPATSRLPVAATMGIVVAGVYAVALLVWGAVGWLRWRQKRRRARGFWVRPL